MKRIKSTLALLAAFLIYAFVSIFTKYSSLQEPFSIQYFLGFGGAFGIMGIYAVLWQQVLKRIPLTEAYMFKGSSLVFIILLSNLLFNETISITNVIGSFFIIAGIAIFAKS